VILPNGHRLAALKSISPRDLVGETFVAVSNTAPVLHVIIDDYLKRSGVDITPHHEADHLAMGMSLIKADTQKDDDPEHRHDDRQRQTAWKHQYVTEQSIDDDRTEQRQCEWDVAIDAISTRTTSNSAR
jgi:LysR substrate binding domain